MKQVSVLTKDSYQYTFDLRIIYKECDSFDPSRYILETKVCLQNEVLKYKKSQFDSLLKEPMWLGSILRNKNVYAIELRQRN